MNRDFSDSYKESRRIDTASPAVKRQEENPEPVELLDDSIDRQLNFYSAKSTYARIGFAVAILAMVSLIVQLALAFGITFIEKTMIQNGTLKAENAFSNSSWYNWFLSFVPLYGFALPAMLLVIKKMPIIPREKQKMGAGSWVVVAIIGIGVMFVGSIIGNCLTMLIDSLTGTGAEDALESTLATSSLLQVMIFTCICAPLGEELIFRKLLIDRTRAFGDRTAIVFSALVFGLFHGNITQTIYATGLGIMLGYIYTKSGKYHLCVLLHALVNFLMGFLPLLARKFYDPDAVVDLDASEEFEYITQHLGGYLLSAGLGLLEIGCAVAALVLIIVRAKRAKYRQPELPLEKGMSGRAAFGNVGAIVALCTLSTIVIFDIIIPLLTQ